MIRAIGFLDLLLIGLLVLSGCTTAQVARIQGYQDQIVSACNLALPLAAVPIIGTYITAGCATEQAIAKLALDPSSLAWVNGLIVKAKTVKPA